LYYFLTGNVRIAGEKMMMKKIEFIASLPPIQSAINIDGQGNGARIKLDIPASELNRIIELQGYIGQSFKVTIEENLG
jgi:hypothetical protein